MVITEAPIALTAPILRAARGLLGWSQADLATASMVSRPTIDSIERCIREPQHRTVVDIVRALEGSGVEFIRWPSGTIRGVAFR